MRSYRVECIDPRDDTIINIESVKADLFMVSCDNLAVTFYVEKEVCGMTPVAMFPFKYLLVIIAEESTEEN